MWTVTIVFGLILFLLYLQLTWKGQVIKTADVVSVNKKDGRWVVRCLSRHKEFWSPFFEISMDEEPQYQRGDTLLVSCDHYYLGGRELNYTVEDKIDPSDWENLANLAAG